MTENLVLGANEIRTQILECGKLKILSSDENVLEVINGKSEFGIGGVRILGPTTIENSITLKSDAIFDNCKISGKLTFSKDSNCTFDSPVKFYNDIIHENGLLRTPYIESKRLLCNDTILTESLTVSKVLCVSDSFVLKDSTIIAQQNNLDIYSNIIRFIPNQPYDKKNNNNNDLQVNFFKRGSALSDSDYEVFRIYSSSSSSALESLVLSLEYPPSSLLSTNNSTILTLRNGITNSNQISLHRNGVVDMRNGNLIVDQGVISSVITLSPNLGSTLTNEMRNSQKSSNLFSDLITTVCIKPYQGPAPSHSYSLTLPRILSAGVLHVDENGQMSCIPKHNDTTPTFISVTCRDSITTNEVRTNRLVCSSSSGISDDSGGGSLVLSANKIVLQQQQVITGNTQTIPVTSSSCLEVDNIAIKDSGDIIDMAQNSEPNPKFTLYGMKYIQGYGYQSIAASSSSLVESMNNIGCLQFTRNLLNDVWTLRISVFIQNYFMLYIGNNVISYSLSPTESTSGSGMKWNDSIILGLSSTCVCPNNKNILLISYNHGYVKLTVNDSTSSTLLNTFGITGKTKFGISASVISSIYFSPSSFSSYVFPDIDNNTGNNNNKTEEGICVNGNISTKTGNISTSKCLNCHQANIEKSLTLSGNEDVDIDFISGSLRLQGGANVKKSLVLGGQLIFLARSGNYIKLAMKQDSGSFTLILPTSLPFCPSVLACDQTGECYWHPI